MTKPDSAIRHPQPAIVWLFFAFVIIAVYFFGLTIPLVGPDEPRYAQIAREMFQRNDWITPTLGGFNWFEKPALLYWLQIVSYKIFGVSEFAARFGSALSGLGTIFCLWILGRFTEEDATKTTADHRPQTDFANRLALIAASSVGLIVFSRGASFDIILTFPITASLVCFFIFDSKTSASPATSAIKYLFGFYFFIGVALLAKGLVGIVFPFAIVAFYYLLSRKFPNKIFIFSLLWGTILSLLVAALWYAPMYQKHGWTFVDEFFVQQQFERFTSDKYKHWQPFWFFFVVLPLMTLPWLPFFLASIWDFIRVQSSKFKAQSSGKFSFLPLNASPLLIFSFAWLLVPLVFFSFSGSKLPGYILPALPAALILTGEYVYRFVQKSKKRKIAVQISAFLVFAAAILLQFVVPKFAFNDSVKGLVESADAKGYAAERITNLYVVWHNAEFYANERLLRDADGKLKRYDDFSVLVNDLKNEKNGEILVFVPEKDLKQVTESGMCKTEVLAANDETALVLVKSKN